MSCDLHVTPSVSSVPRRWKFQPTWVGPLLRLQCWVPVFLFYNQWTSSDDNWRGRQSLFAPDPPLYLMCLQSLQHTRFWISYDCHCFIDGITEAQE